MKKAVTNSRLGESNTSGEEIILKPGRLPDRCEEQYSINRACAESSNSLKCLGKWFHITKTMDRREMKKQGVDFGLKMLST